MRPEAYPIPLGWGGRTQFDFIESQKISDSLPGLANFYMGEYNKYCGFKYLADGELSREKENWDDALNNYKNSKQNFEISSGFYLKSKLLQARSLQETVINLSSIVEIYERQCKKEQLLRDELKKFKNEADEFKKSLIESAQSAGVTINNVQEVTSLIKQNLEIKNIIDNGIKQRVEEIANEVQKIPLEQNKKDEILDMAKELINSKEQGKPFLERAKNFTKDVSEIVENVGKTAEPVMPLLKILGTAISVFI
ncbi:MAG: hypothetical protein WA137_03960 [Methanothrix sp.]